MYVPLDNRQMFSIIHYSELDKLTYCFTRNKYKKNSIYVEDTTANPFQES